MNHPSGTPDEHDLSAPNWQLAADPTAVHDRLKAYRSRIGIEIRSFELSDYPSIVVVIGGSSGIGLATAQAVSHHGMRPVIIGRDSAKLADAIDLVGSGAEGFVADAGDRAAIDRVFSEIGPFGHLVIAASGGRGAGPFASISRLDLQAGFDGKFWAHWNATQAALSYLSPTGSVTMITGASSRVASPGTSGLAAINGALERMIPTLARELAPIRINAVSPGVIETQWWADKPAGLFESASQRIPLRRAGQPTEAADAVLFVIRNEYVTGITLDIDGGLHLT